MYSRPKIGLLMLSIYCLVPIVFFWAAVACSVFFKFDGLLYTIMGTPGNDMWRSVLVAFVFPLLSILFAGKFLLKPDPQYKSAGIAVIVTATISLFAVSAYIISDNAKDLVTGIDTFAECEAAGFPIMESYPRQCSSTGGRTFTEVIE